MTLDKAKAPRTKKEWTSICEALLIDRPLPNTERENERQTMMHTVEELIRLSEHRDRDAEDQFTVRKNWSPKTSTREIYEASSYISRISLLLYGRCLWR